MQQVDFEEGKFSAFLAEGEIVIIRKAWVERSEMLTTDKLLAEPGWFALNSDEFGDTLVERYQKIF